LVDRDIEAAIEDGKLPSWDDATGHSAIEKVFGYKGEHVEGREGLPEAFAKAIKRGECNRMAKVEPAQAVKHVYDLLPEELTLWADEYNGSLDLRGCTLPEGLKLPSKIGGSLYLRGCTLPEGLKLPSKIGGSLYLRGCTLPEGLKLPSKIGGSLDLSGCTLPEGLKLPSKIGGYLDLSGCTLSEGLKLPTECGYLDLRGCTLPEGLKLPTECGSLDLRGCTYRGQSVHGKTLNELRELIA
jgi:hypothetical protein